MAPSPDALALGAELQRHLGPSEQVTVGVAQLPLDAEADSGGVGLVSAAREGYREARRCVDALLALGRQGSVCDPAGLGLARLLLGTAGPGELGDFVSATIGPVLDYDERRQGALVETLQAWFAAGGSLREAGAALHVHPNTVAQRLDLARPRTSPRSAARGAPAPPPLGLSRTLLFDICRKQVHAVGMDVQQRPIGYWLVQLDGLINQHLGHTLAEHDLTRRQWQVLNLVVHGPCDLATIDQSVAPFLTAAEPTVAPEVAELLQAGWVEMADDLVHISTSGRHRFAQAQAAVTQMRGNMSAGVSRAAYETTVSTLQQMASNLGWQEPA